MQKTLTLVCIVLTSVGLSILAMSCSRQRVRPTTNLFPTSKPTNILRTSLIPTETKTPIPRYGVIDENNANHLEILHQWDIERELVDVGGTSLWFSNSRQFIIPTTKDSVPGVQSFSVDNFDTLWFTQIDLPWGITTDNNNHFITFSGGLHILDTKGQEIQTIATQNNCDEGYADYVAAIPGTDSIITGHKDATDEGGLNNPGINLSSLIIWDIKKKTCLALRKKFTGQLFSLSVSPDGQFISYGFGTRNASYDWLLTTKIYDLHLRQERCNFSGLYARFNLQDQIAIYSPNADTIPLIKLSDCKKLLEFNVTTKLSSIVFSPNGALLAGASDDSIVYIWSVKSGEKLEEINLQGTSSIFPLIDFSPDGRFLIVTKDEKSSTNNHKLILLGIPEN